MANWFEEYDQQTYLQPFASINYESFNPLSEKNIFTKSYGFELVVH